MRIVTLSLVTREHARDFVDHRAPGAHPMDAVTCATLRFREYDVGVTGRDLQRVAIQLAGNLPDIGLEDATPNDWEHTHGIWSTYICRESQEPYCRRIYALMFSSGHADMLEADLRAVMGDTISVIQALASILTGCRENEGPALEASWPDGDVTLADGRSCVLLVRYVNPAIFRGETSMWRVIRDAAVTKTGVVVGEMAYNGFTGLHSLLSNE